MSKRFCFWCQTGTLRPNQMLSLHQDCFFKALDVRDKIDFAVKYAKGEMPKILENGDRRGYESFEKFLVAMDDFNRKWKNFEKIIEKMGK